MQLNVQGELKNKFATVSKAQDALGITLELYIDGIPDEVQQLHVSPALLGKIDSIS